MVMLKRPSLSTDLLHMMVRLYYRIKTPTLAAIGARLLSYETRNRILSRASVLEDERRVRSMMKGANGPKSERRVALFRSPVDIPSGSGEIISREDASSLVQLHPVPVWGAAPLYASGARSHWEMPRITCVLRQATLEGDCLGLFEDKDFFGMHLAQAAPGFFQSYNNVVRVTVGRTSGFELTRKARTLEVDRALFFCCNRSYADNYFHFMVEALPSILRTCASVSAHRGGGWKILVPESLPPTIATVIERVIAESGHSSVRFGSGDRLHLHEVCFSPYSSTMCDVPGLSQLNAFSVNRQDILDVKRFFDRAFCTDGEAPGVTVSEHCDLLYLSRRRLGEEGKRHIRNAEALESIVLARGGRVVYPESMTISQQRRAVSAARVVVVDAGAAVANAVFCKPGAGVLILTHDAAHPQLFFSFLQALDIRAGLVTGIAESQDEATLAHSSCRIDEVAFESALAYLNGESRSTPPRYFL